MHPIFSSLPMVVALFVWAAPSASTDRQRTGMAIPVTQHSGLIESDGSINFSALDSHIASVKAKTIRGIENYERNTARKHPFVLQTNERRQNPVPLTNYDSSADEIRFLWHGKISLGTPAKLFDVVFDTGSSDLFLPNITCDKSCNNHVLWDPSSSSTSNNLEKPCNLRYADGSSVSGGLYTDNVLLAGFTATAQTICAAHTYSLNLQRSNYAADGLMGMGFEELSIYGSSPVFQTLIAQGQMSVQVFSLKLTSLGAELYVGGANSALYCGDFTYMPVMAGGFWLVLINNIQNSDGRVIMSYIPAIIDTGAASIFGPSLQVSRLYDEIGGTPIPSQPGRYSFPCDSFPSLAVNIGGTIFKISSGALNMGNVSPGSSDCFSGITGENDAQHRIWTFGCAFLENVYTTFDVSGLQVGFAKLASPGQNKCSIL